MLDNYMRDRKSDSMWSINDIQVLGGLISYYCMVEKDYINHLLRQYSVKHGADISQYSVKHGADIKKCMKEDLSSTAES